MKYLPLFACGRVVKGYGRGSKQLGIPTANMEDDVVKQLPSEIDCGIYYGWANVDNGPVHKMVMSIGWNPYYQNHKKSMETYIMHEFNDDFYGSILKLAVLGYLRPEKNFSSVDELIAAIRRDIANADSLLDSENLVSYKTSPFFKQQNNIQCAFLREKFYNLREE